MTLLFLPAPTHADAPEDFKKGMEAANFNRWDESVRHLRQALAADSQESTQQIFLSGVFSVPYLPHFYLGDALLKQNPDVHCEEAIRAWDESLRQGVIRKFKRQAKELDKGRAQCLEIVIPKLSRQGADAVAEVETLMRPWVNTQAPPDLETERRRILSQLAEAKSLHSEGNQAKSVTRLRAALDSALAIQGAARDFGPAVQRNLSEALDGARSTARRSVIDAEAAQAALQGEIADLNPQKRREYDLQAQTLRGLRTQLTNATTLDDIQRLGKNASPIGTFFDTLRQEQSQARRAQIAPPPSRPSSTPPPTRPTEPASSAASSARGTDTNRTHRNTVNRPQASGSETPPVTAQRPEVREPVAQARRLRGTVGEPPSDQSSWTGTLRRLDALIQQSAGPLDDAQLQTWSMELAKTSRALVALAGMEAYFNGAVPRAVDVLSLGTADVSADPDDRALELQILLFRAAARFNLYHLRGQVEPEVRASMLDDIRRCLEIQPDFQPSPTYFSPDFRAHFTSP